MQTKQSVINSNVRATVIAAFGVLLMVLAVSETAQAQASRRRSAGRIPSRRTRRCLHSGHSRCVPRSSWGPTTSIIQARSQKGRREINWDGGNPNVLDTTAPVTPFNVFLNTRGSQFKTPGLGLSQAPPSGGPQGGLAVLFGNPNLCHNLQGIQRVAVVHSCGEQHYRSLLLHTGYQWHCPGNSQRLRRGVHRC